MKNSVVYINCISGVPTEVILEDGILLGITEQNCGAPAEDVASLSESINTRSKADGRHYIAPGLIDLQINGVNGIDFNDVSVTAQQVTDAAYYLLSQGITTFFPTLITNSEQNFSSILSTIRKACASDPLVNSCIAGIHLEGPFLSSVNGARGAHDERFLKLPDWQLFEGWQQAAEGRIKLVTVAPELEGAFDFIEKCRNHGIIVSIGHSMANFDQIQLAVKAGASLSTHLGNAVPLNIPRHPNILWDILATDQLYACIIADGLHVPDSFIKVVMKVKGEATLLVSDATCFAGMAPGEYQSPIGGSVILDAEKRVSLKTTPGLLAGAAKSLLENVETLTAHKLASLGEAWKMASVSVSDMVAKQGIRLPAGEDFVLFDVEGGKIRIKTVIKNKRIVFGN
ncbi:N-acetylglucosamine-6-phosphate deacetylase [Flavitalea antarctica]